MSNVVCHLFTLGEIEEATKNFEKILGHGGEGTVYLGHIPTLGTVAVKRFKSNQIDFEEEIEIVSKIKHPNLVSFHGYCEESGQKILVYEYMRKGSLSDYITKKCRTTAVYLSWQQRLNICLGAARGLQHLHKETEEYPKGIIHRDIKPDNILLDDNWVAKISDFGLCKLSHAGQNKSTMITLLKGTGGYYAPEYIQYGSITRKLDVYAFGVVLFEVLCHKTPWDRGDESYYRLEDEDLGLWACENVDPAIREEISDECLEAFTHIIGRSLQINPRLRPTMDDVVMDLECALKCQDCQDEETRPKAPTREGRKVTIPSSLQKTIQNIKEITKNSEDEIYAMLKECSMDPFQTIQKLHVKGRKTNETTAELPESSNSIVRDDGRDITMGRRPATVSYLLSREGPHHRTAGKATREFGFDELKEATNNFDAANIILREEFGITYKGLLSDGQTVAVKKYIKIDKKIYFELYMEVDIYYNLFQANLVHLIGVCESPHTQEFLLVHEFMKNGPLADYLFGGEGEGDGASLSWEQWLRICFYVAKGLECLHHGFTKAQRIIHRNITLENILLDEYWTPKIGFAQMGNANNQKKSMRTRYPDPELYEEAQHLTLTTDIYSFGVMLLDVVFGRKGLYQEIEHKKENLSEWIQQCVQDGSLYRMIDKRLKGQISPDCLMEFAELASWCVHDDPKSRPTVTHVLDKLNYTLVVCQEV